MTDEMSAKGHWATLGIAPTSDTKLVRRTYAQLLKAIDIDKDPRAFITLRSAYECALSELAPPPQPDVRIDSEGSRPNSETGFAAHRAEDSILALLRSNLGRTEIAPQLRALTEAVVDRSREGSLLESEMIEYWLADTIVAGVPRSNAMLGPAIKGFRWDERVAAYDCPEPVRFIVARSQDLEALYALQELNPDVKIAWSALTEGSVDFETVHLGCMNTLLGMVQHRHPNLTDDIDIEYFQRWADHLDAARAAERLKVAARPSDLPIGRHPILETALNLFLLLVGLAFIVGAVILIIRFPDSILSSLWAFLMFCLFGGFFIATARDRQARLKRQLGADGLHG